MASSAIQKELQPFNLVRLCLDEDVFVKLRGGRELRGRLHAYDQHMNLILGNVEETALVFELDQKGKESYKKQKRNMDLLYVRGDGVILLSPPNRS